MNRTDIDLCAQYYQENYLKTFYLVITYNGKSFILIGERANFPHLMGIPKNTYRSNGYARPQYLFDDIIHRRPVSTAIIPNNIATTSKMYKKVLNFTKSADIFWLNSGPLTVNYNPVSSSTKLNNVDALLTDIQTGYMLGWVSNSSVPANENINIEKYCICTWIDESNGSTQGKEKYMPNQDVELIRFVFSFDENSKLKKKKEYIYNISQKREILYSCERNNSNLLIDNHSARHYIDLAARESIHCKINGMQY